MSLIKRASFDNNLLFELIIILQNSDFQPPVSPNHGGLIKAGGHPQTPARKHSGLLFYFLEVICTIVCLNRYFTQIPNYCCIFYSDGIYSVQTIRIRVYKNIPMS
jgi:hypothetical protein